MIDSEHTVVIYTDGGADPNPGPGGWGAVLRHPQTSSTKELSGGDEGTTNNRMELTAAIEALDALSQPCRVDLFTDSQYLKKGVTRWLKGWIARDFVKKDGDEVKNQDLWRRLAVAIERHQIRWKWVRGHTGVAGNERADELATQEIRKRQRRATPAASPSATADATPALGGAEVFLKVSCPKKRGAWAALVRHGDEEDNLFGTLNDTTANQLDILAAAEALKTLPRAIPVAVYCGSDYLRNGASQWITGWIKKGWKTGTGAPVKNREEWQRLSQELDHRQVTWPTFKGRDLPEIDALAPVLKAALDGS